MNQAFTTAFAWILIMKMHQIIIFLLAVQPKNMFFLFASKCKPQIRIFRIEKDLSKKASEDNIGDKLLAEF